MREMKQNNQTKAALSTKTTPFLGVARPIDLGTSMWAPFRIH